MRKNSQHGRHFDQGIRSTRKTSRGIFPDCFLHSFTSNCVWYANPLPITTRGNWPGRGRDGTGCSNHGPNSVRGACLRVCACEFGLKNFQGVGEIARVGRLRRRPTGGLSQREEESCWLVWNQILVCSAEFHHFSFVSQCQSSKEYPSPEPRWHPGHGQLRGVKMTCSRCEIIDPCVF